MLSAKLDSLGVRPLEETDAAELHALVEANREHLARWMPWAAVQDLAGTERFLAEAGERVEIHCAPENRRSRAIPERLASAKKRGCGRRSTSAGATSTASSTGCWRESGGAPPPEQTNPDVWAGVAFACRGRAG